MQFITKISSYLSGVVLPACLIVAGIFLMKKLKFFPFFNIKQLIGDTFSKEVGKKGVSSFKAVTVSLAGTLGVGNIVGVAQAIALGGYGTVFWMWVSGFFAMIIKYAEANLAQVFKKEKRVKDKITYFGGAPYYINEGLKTKHRHIIAIIFCVFCLFNSILLGNMIQSNAISVSLKDTFDVPLYISGIVTAILLCLIVFGGIGKISSFTVKFIPIASILYVFISMIIITWNIESIPRIFARIIKEAFSVKGIAGGGVYTAFTALRHGVAKGILSNEAGCGSSPFSHAAASTNSPHKQGCWGIFEVFVDTFLLCSMTALVILVSFDELVLDKGLSGIILSVRAYERFIGSAAGIIIAVSVAFFAFSSIVCWAYYGCQCIEFITDKKRYSKIYLFVFAFSVILGAVINLGFVWEASDVIITVMTLINTISVCAMYKSIKRR